MICDRSVVCQIELSMSYTSCIYIYINRSRCMDGGSHGQSGVVMSSIPLRASPMETVDLEIRDVSNFFCYVPCIQLHTSHNSSAPPHNTLKPDALTGLRCPRSRRTRYPRSRPCPGRSSSTIGTRTPTTSSPSSSPSIRTTRSGGRWS